MPRKLVPFALLLAVAVAGCVGDQQNSTPSVPVVSENSNEGQSAPQAGPNVKDVEPGEFITTVSGLKYRILRESDGPKPSAYDTVKCHYKGWLDDGTEFDSSYSRGEPATFGLSQVVKGWTEGLQLVGEGGKIELEIPYELGYGVQGRPPTIPPAATLHFEVELLEIQ